MPKIYYVANARMPNEKAHGIQIAKMCEAFLTSGVDLTLVVPARKNTICTLKEFYGLSTTVPILRIPVPDLYLWGPVGFAVSSLFFMFFVELYLAYKKIMGERFFIYTIDMDNFSYAFLPLVGKTFTEMHTPKTPSLLQRFFFATVSGVVATNGLILRRFVDDYSLPSTQIISEPNGVDMKQFASEITQAEARVKLSLPGAEKIVLYIGRFYRWKGLDILAPACAKLPPEVKCYVVGGTKESFIEMTGVTKIPNNLIFIDARPPSEIPLWLQAADALLLLGTAKNEDSNRYTSPMKLFEYMAAKKPIVASATPAVSDVLTREDAFLFVPDDTLSLVNTIEKALLAIDAPERVRRAQNKVRAYTWDLRAKRILSFIASQTKGARTQ